MHGGLWSHRPLLPEYPDIKLEFDANYGFRDIVADRFDAGVRLGSDIDRDMIAVPIGPPMRLAVVASPMYLAVHPHRERRTALPGTHASWSSICTQVL